MNKIFLLIHSYESAHGEDVIKILGVFSDRDAAEKAIDRLRDLPGFIDHAEGFYIDSYTLDSVKWTEGFLTDK